MSTQDDLAELERIARQAHQYSHAEHGPSAIAEHPFVVRDIYEGFPPKIRNLFDDGHYAEASFAAYKYLDQAVQRVSKLSTSGEALMGEALMMEAFKEDAPKIELTPSTTTTERDERWGYRFLFAEAVVRIRILAAMRRLSPTISRPVSAISALRRCCSAS